MQAYKKWVPVWVIPIVVAMAIATVWLRLSIIRASYSLSQLEGTLKNLASERDRLRIEIARLKSPKRLEGLSEKFDLRNPKPEQVIFLK